MNRREAILQELGLWPAWVPRERASAPESTPAATSGATPEALLEGAPGSRAERIARMDWPALREAVRTCTACPLHARRQQAVFGVGDEQADWLFVGEGPGAEEDARGEPFVGQAGRLLDNMLAAIGLQRGRDVYIGNVVKCRPPGNRVPEPNEAAACEPFLLRQMALIQPRLIVALGKTAASNLLRTDASIASLRGRLHDFCGTPLLVTYHPAYLLRNLPDKSKAWEDLCLAREVMQRLKAGEPAPI
ncbi:MAG TPA: uracil-DNA glycosylase [Burkholderiales bacterium]|jgi:DNA polymerase